MSEIIIGPRDNNNCCICCHNCEGAVGLPHGCVSDCCPCPDIALTSSISANIVITKADGSECNSFSVTMDSGDGETLCGSDPYACYNGDVDPAKHWEKWGNEGGKYCSEEEGCEGQYIDFAVCCCPGLVSGPEFDCEYIPLAGASNCNACNFQMFMFFRPGATSAYTEEGINECSCPDGYDECQMIPGDRPDGSVNHGQICLDLRYARCREGDTPILFFAKEDQYWNCDCCFGGCEEGDTVEISAIIF